MLTYTMTFTVYVNKTCSEHFQNIYFLSKLWTLSSKPLNSCHCSNSMNALICFQCEKCCGETRTLSAGGSWPTGDIMTSMKVSFLYRLTHNPVLTGPLQCNHLNVTQVDTIWPQLIPISARLCFHLLSWEFYLTLCL